MRESLYALTPVVVVTYFVLYPGHLSIVASEVMRLLH